MREAYSKNVGPSLDYELNPFEHVPVSSSHKEECADPGLHQRGPKLRLPGNSQICSDKIPADGSESPKYLLVLSAALADLCAGWEPALRASTTPGGTSSSIRRSSGDEVVLELQGSSYAVR